MQEIYAFVLQNLFYKRLFALKTNAEFGEKLEITECLEMCNGTVLNKGEEGKKREWNYCR